MSELSIFIDESGDFGPYDYRSPYYIITMVFHDQAIDISAPIAKLNTDLANRGFPNHCVHTGPIIRRENEYEFESIETRRRILNSMVTFIKHCKVRYHSFHIEKKHIEDSVQASAQLSLLISRFLKSHYEEILLKMAASALSSSELEFFGNTRDMKKNYLNPLSKFRWD